MLSIDLWILRWPPQPFVRLPYIILPAEVLFLGVDIDAVSADSLRVAAVLLIVFPGLRDQIFRFIVRISADPV